MPHLKPRWRWWLKLIFAIPSNTKKSTTYAVEGPAGELLVNPRSLRCLPRRGRLHYHLNRDTKKQKMLQLNVQSLYFMRENYVRVMWNYLKTQRFPVWSYCIGLVAFQMDYWKIAIYNMYYTGTLFALKCVEKNDVVNIFLFMWRHCK